MVRFINVIALLLAATPGFAETAGKPLELLRAGQYDAARTALLPIVNGRPNAKADMKVFEAMILVHKGQANAAISLLRDLLIEQPKHEAARRDLVFLLAGRNDHKAAIFHAERLLQYSKDKRLKKDLSKYIAVRGQGKPRGVSFRFAILPSNNFNQGTQNSELKVGALTFEIDEASKARSGVGVTAGATAWNRWRLNPKWDATMQASLDIKTYPSVEVPTEITLGSKLLFRRALKKGSLSFGPTFELLRSNGETQRKRFGAIVSMQHNLDQRRQLNYKLEAFKQLYPTRDYNNGSLYRANFTYRQIVSPSTVVTVSLPLEKEETDRSHLDHTELGLSASLAHDWRSGLSTTLSLGVFRDQYDSNFPGLNLARSDLRRTIGLKIKNRKFKIGRFVPEVSYTYTLASSNVAFFDYTAHDVGLSMLSKF